MGRVSTKITTVERVLQAYAAIPFSYGDVVSQPVFDRERGQFLIMLTGWDPGKRVQGCLVHLALRDGPESGIATNLIGAGIPAEQIVLAFYPPDDRAVDGFAVA